MPDSLFIFEEDALHSILSNDVETLARSDLNDPFIRRLLVRAIFALIEGIIYGMKQIAASEPARFPAKELAQLQEQTEYVDEQNQRLRIRRQPLEDSVKLAFKAFTKYIGSDFSLNCDNPGWPAFKTAKGIRDRLTHPKKVTHLEVTEEDLATTIKAYLWFQNNYALCQLNGRQAQGDPDDSLQEQIQATQQILHKDSYTWRMPLSDFQAIQNYPGENPIIVHQNDRTEPEGTEPWPNTSKPC